MKLTTIAFAAALALCGAFAFAQQAERQAAWGPHRRSRSRFANHSSPTTGSSTSPNRSGSGTSTSGGSDANGDQGRDKMPDSSQGVRPYDQQNKPDRK